MEISARTTSTFKVRLKEATVLVDPNKVTITAAQRDLPFEIAVPGEYEVQGVSVFAYKNFKSLVFLITADGLNLVYAGDQKGRLPEELFDQIDEVAVLFAPTLESASVSQAEPRYLVLTQPATAALAPIDKLVIQAGKLPEEREVVILNGRN
jgi:hypothetical protein